MPTVVPTVTEPLLLGSLTGPGWYRGAVDPTVGAGVPATLGSIYSRTDTGQIYWKSGAPDTSWTVVGASSGGSWIEKVTTADFTTSSATVVAIVPASGEDLTFAPEPDSHYAVRGFVIGSALVGSPGVVAQVGVVWPGGLAGFGAAQAMAANVASGNVFGNNTQGVNFVANVTAVPSAVDGWGTTFWASFTTGAAPTGVFAAGVESETGGTDVTVRAGSYIEYRRRDV